MNQTAYEILDLNPKASLLEIRRVYRQKVRDCHPDLAGNDALEKFLQIQRAYEILSHPQKRLHLGQVRIFPAVKIQKNNYENSTQTFLDNLRRMKEGRA